jgi:DNA invertase Pin-like site-specific DNA recombinase
MTGERKRRRCAVYTRVSTDHGLEQEFNSLDAQREASRAYIKSQAHEGWTPLRDGYDDGGYSGGSLDRPSLQQLLAGIRARRIDVVVVYKVDRLTRSLADFAKLVELFDAHGVSFVSVTQSFNTTTSMGLLTLNVLLSFAQFEREVTSERIRDKIAASKRRGLWVGGPVPLGYAVQNKKLVVVAEEAERVRLIIRLYLELGSLGRLLPELRRRGILTRRRELADGKVIGGIPFTRGPLAYLLRNRFYLGEVVYRGKVNPGEHAAILQPELFAAVQERLAQQHHGFVCARADSQALLLGRLFDDRGNRMSPTHANKQGVRYRYYVSCALAQGRPQAVGSVARVAAAQVEQPVLQALRQHRPDLAAAPNRELIGRCVDRVVIDSDTIAITLRDGVSGSEHEQQDAADAEASAETAVAMSVLRIPWAPMNSKRRREVILPAQAEVPDQRPIRAETRATLVRAIALGRRWLDELSAGSIPGPAAIASREGCSQRHVERTISLAFLAPDLVQAAIEGRLPRGVGASRLIDLPSEWRRQWQMLGLP